MSTKTILVTAITCAVFALTTSMAFAWGASRSVSASNSRGGSYSHSSSTSGGGGSFSHSGSTSVTGRDGNTYNTSHSGSGHYGDGGVSYHGTTGGGASYGGAAYHTGGYGAVHYGGTYSTGFHVGVATTTAVYHGPGVAVGVAAAPVYRPFAAGVYGRRVFIR